MTEERDNQKLSQAALDNIIENAKEFFRKEVAPSHIANTKKLVKLKRIQP